MREQRETWAQLSAGNCQLLICDLQEQIVACSKTTRPEAISQSAEVLCRIAQVFAIPITFSVVPEQQQEPRLLPFLKPFASGRNQFLRANASPFLGAKTRDHIASLSHKTLLLAGFASEVVVLHAAMQAAEGGLSRHCRGQCVRRELRKHRPRRVAADAGRRCRSLFRAFHSHCARPGFHYSQGPRGLPSRADAAADRAK